MLTYKLTLPELNQAGDDDVVTRRLTVNGNTQDYPADQTEVDGFSGNEGDLVEGTLVDIDDAGNASVPSAFSYTLVDEIAPPQPGSVGLVVTGEQ